MCSCDLLDIIFISWVSRILIRDLIHALLHVIIVIVYRSSIGLQELSSKYCPVISPLLFLYYMLHISLKGELLMNALLEYFIEPSLFK